MQFEILSHRTPSREDFESMRQNNTPLLAVQQAHAIYVFFVLPKKTVSLGDAHHFSSGAVAHLDVPAPFAHNTLPLNGYMTWCPVTGILAA